MQRCIAGNKPNKATAIATVPSSSLVLNIILSPPLSILDTKVHLVLSLFFLEIKVMKSAPGKYSNCFLGHATCAAQHCSFLASLPPR